MMMKSYYLYKRNGLERKYETQKDMGNQCENNSSIYVIIPLHI